MSNPKTVLPPTVGSMTDQELADYCHIQNCTASPLVAELVRRIEARQTEDWEAEEVRAVFKGYCYSLDIGTQIEMAKEQVMELVEGSDDVDTIGGVFDDLYTDIESGLIFSPEFGLGEAAFDQVMTTPDPKPRKVSDMKSSKPGPKDFYLPAILAVLREHQLPLPRNELVRAALRSLGVVKGRGIYAAISNAATDKLIVKVGKNQFKLPTKP